MSRTTVTEIAAKYCAETGLDHLGLIDPAPLHEVYERALDAGVMKERGHPLDVITSVCNALASAINRGDRTFTKYKIRCCGSGRNGGERLVNYFEYNPTNNIPECEERL